MSTCDTCKHWGDKVEPPEDVVDTDWTERASTRELRRCNAVPFYYDPEAKAVAACVRDGSGYRASLLTRAEFGCVLHAPKEEL